MTTPPKDLSAEFREWFLVFDPLTGFHRVRELSEIETLDIRVIEYRAYEHALERIKSLEDDIYDSRMTAREQDERSD